MSRDAPSDFDRLLGDNLYRRVERLYPLHRSLTGEGLRATLAQLAERLPLVVTETASGTAVLDWRVPAEWSLRAAHVTAPDGRRLVDLADHPLHVVQYSPAVQTRLPLSALRAHLHTLPDRPGAIPYRTSYYAPQWGFCLAQSRLDAAAAAWGEDALFEVEIDADLADGSMSDGEVVVPGATDDEILLSAHACHPALANDNAASLAVAARLAEDLAAGPPMRHTVRVLFAPGTIGAIAWLDRNRQRLGRIRHGLVLANLGDPGPMTYKRTRAGTLGEPLDVDRAVRVALRDVVGEGAFGERPFEPTGYDERQFGSPGFDLPVGRLTRTPHGEYPEYHTSDDDLSLVRPESLAQSYRVLRQTLTVLDGNERLRNTAPYGEPQLGHRGLYAPTGGVPVAPDDTRAVLWVLNLSDGRHDLIDVAERSGLPFDAVRRAASRLAAAGLLSPESKPTDTEKPSPTRARRSRPRSHPDSA